jgi:3-hydroxyacyl-CoA dehydrogenase / enoyl-CoA hydratase / 3-hydroxybutyryl-CoA epimerase
MTESAVYVLEKMAHGYKRMGRAVGRGFYDYGEPGRELWPGLKTFERGARRVPTEDVADRLAFAVALEAVRSLEAGGVTGAATARTIGMTGKLPVHAPEALKLVDELGLQRFEARARELAARYGERFDPPPSLAQMSTTEQPR